MSVLLSSNASISTALKGETLPNDTQGEIIVKSNHYINVSQAVNDLHEHETRNDLLLELKDKERRMKLWQIYYETQENPPEIVRKDQESIGLLMKKLEELNEERRALNEISVEQPDVLEDYDDPQSLGHQREEIEWRRDDIDTHLLNEV